MYFILYNLKIYGNSQDVHNITIKKLGFYDGDIDDYEIKSKFIILTPRIRHDFSPNIRIPIPTTRRTKTRPTPTSKLPNNSLPSINHLK